MRRRYIPCVGLSPDTQSFLLGGSSASIERARFLFRLGFMIPGAQKNAVDHKRTTD